jgi:hypothetical protein
MALPFSIQSVLLVNDIEGYDIIENAFPVVSNWNGRNITLTEAIYEALTEVISDFEDWDEEDDFGSSDMTFARKSFIDNMIAIAGLHDDYKTAFSPFLKVVSK